MCVMMLLCQPLHNCKDYKHVMKILNSFEEVTKNMNDNTFIHCKKINARFCYKINFTDFIAFFANHDFRKAPGGMNLNKDLKTTNTINHTINP